MNLSKEALKELKQIHFKETGKQLSDEKALEMGIRFLIIRTTVKSGADIYTDGWRSYDALAIYSYNTRRLTTKRVSSLEMTSTLTG
jgi:hypothetical protein